MLLTAGPRRALIVKIRQAGSRDVFPTKRVKPPTPASSMRGAPRETAELARRLHSFPRMTCGGTMIGLSELVATANPALAATLAAARPPRAAFPPPGGRGAGGGRGREEGR